MIAFDVTAKFTAGDAAFELAADLSVADGETLVVLGPSGSGKSLLLETVAGHHPHEGTVRVDDVDVTDRPPEARGFGFVFQDYALFPHLTARENVAFGQRYRDRPVGQNVDSQTGPDETPLPSPDDLLDQLGVADLAARYPGTLSGGERQRVALARSLAIDPEVLLLDEPLAALDVPTRAALRGDLADVLADITAIYVTHNRTTARAIADRIAVMYEGAVIQAGTPVAVFDSPASATVAEFVGANVLPGSLLDADADLVAVRPEHVRIDGDREATVERVVREDAAFRVTCAVDGEQLTAFAADPPAVGDAVGLRILQEHVVPIE